MYLLIGLKISTRFRELVKNPLLIEQYLTEARIPEIIKCIDNRQTIIYTEYVTGIIEMIAQAVKDEGYSYALYTGQSHEKHDLQRFKNEQVKVLIASKPVSVGVDGLQVTCNNLVINTLPWTNAQYKQLIGRLHRLGQRKDFVDIHVIMTTMAGYEYDRHKWTRLEFKRTLADCAVDGKMPEGKLQTKEQMQLELIRWLERLERNEISIFERKKLSIELTPNQRVEYERKISEFSKLNNIWNRSYSDTIHDRIAKDPKFLVEYHEKLQEIKSRWPIDPVNVIAEKINSLKIPANVIMKLVIGDFGSGKCELSKLLRENKVYCFDHHKILYFRMNLLLDVVI
jgi:SNF2 family DNA or RNA helicase